MTRKLRLFLVHFADWLDVYVLRHRFERVCTSIATSSWWGDNECLCRYCSKFRHVLDE